jgi:hypothetical protein
MAGLPKETKMGCEKFVKELEGLPPEEKKNAAPVELLGQMTGSARAHVPECAVCKQALEDFQETRNVLTGLRENAPAPGPWFTTRVMRAIAARENEMEESRNSVWMSVRRLAPRLAALAAVLLVVGGTWAIELRRAERQVQQPEMRAVEGLFEGSTGAPVNDDIVASAAEEQLR